MKAQELRIGNLVDVINRSGKVHFPNGIELRIISVGLFSAQCVPNEIETYRATSDVIMTIPISDLCPINITEEVLVRFGFECVYKSNIHSFYAIGRGTLSYYFWYDSNNQYASFGGTKISCKNVHSLQNLCFALTSSELNINNN